jgi:hypothetical protein
MLSYSPELNLDEYLSCDLKTGIPSSKPARSKAQFKGKVISHMRMLQNKPARMAKYFRHEKIRYAALQIWLFARLIVGVSRQATSDM